MHRRRLAALLGLRPQPVAAVPHVPGELDALAERVTRALAGR